MLNPVTKSYTDFLSILKRRLVWVSHRLWSKYVCLLLNRLVATTGNSKLWSTSRLHRSHPSFLTSGRLVSTARRFPSKRTAACWSCSFFSLSGWRVHLSAWRGPLLYWFRKVSSGLNSFPGWMSFWWNCALGWNLRVIPGLVCRSCLGFGRHLGYRRFSFSGWLVWTRLFEKEY